MPILRNNCVYSVIPAKAGIHLNSLSFHGFWMPTFVGMTPVKTNIFSRIGIMCLPTRSPVTTMGCGAPTGREKLDARFVPMAEAMGHVLEAPPRLNVLSPRLCGESRRFFRRVYGAKLK